MCTREKRIMHTVEKQRQVSEEELVQRGLEAVDTGDLALGLELLGALPPANRSPVVTSYLACCIAGEQGRIEEAKALCAQAMQKEPVNSVHYLNLGRIHLLEGDKKEAIRMFRDGLLYGNNQLIRKEMDKLGRRSPPVFPSLGRENPLNRMIGLVRKKLRM